MNGITPIDAHNAHYFYAFSRNFGVDQQWATDELVDGLRTVLQEDADALALQEIGLQTRPPGEFDVLIAQDAGVAKARKVMARLLAAERQGTITTADLETSSS
jgi:vanillate O-demethylase monooxygenase subunit